MKKYKILFIIIFPLLFLIPIWGVRYIPLQDWPVFIGFSYIISHLSHFQSHFAVKPIPPPYLTGFLLLAGLMRIFPPFIAGKVLLSIYIISFFASFYYYLRILNPNALFLYFFAPLLVFNNFFAKGNINFILSIPLFLFAVPFFIKKLNNDRWYNLLLLFFLSLLLYFTHIFTYLAFLLFLLIFTFTRKRNATFFAVSFIPFLFFIFYFLTNKSSLGLSFYNSFLTKFLSFRDTFGTWTPYFDVALLFLPFLIFFFLVLQGWRKTENVWKIVLFFLFLTYLFSPEEIYTLSRPDQRILPFAFFVLLVFPERIKSDRVPFLFILLFVSLSFVNLVRKEQVFVSLQPKIRICEKVITMVPQNKGIVSIGTKKYYIGVINPFLHILTYSVPLQNNINIPYYEWNIPLFTIIKYPKPNINNSIIDNLDELLTYYDYFFVMEEDSTFDGQLKNFTEPIYHNGNIKLFKKK